MEAAVGESTPECDNRADRPDDDGGGGGDSALGATRPRAAAAIIMVRPTFLLLFMDALAKRAN